MFNYCRSLSQFLKLVQATHKEKSCSKTRIIRWLYWGRLYIDLMWLEGKLRCQGYGHRLLTQVEDEARKRGARQVYLDTFNPIRRFILQYQLDKRIPLVLEYKEANLCQ